MQDRTETIRVAARALLRGECDTAQAVIDRDYPFVPVASCNRRYSIAEKLAQFKRDGFIDRYSGDKLVHPALLRVLSYHLPQSFPYHSNWKMSECHIGYWELVPTLDHIHPVALGGIDAPENWATTSMLHNSIKSNWTLEQLKWQLVPQGNYADWDGLTGLFLELVEADPILLEKSYIKGWYRATLNIL